MGVTSSFYDYDKDRLDRYEAELRRILQEARRRRMAVDGSAGEMSWQQDELQGVTYYNFDKNKDYEERAAQNCSINFRKERRIVRCIFRCRLPHLNSTKKICTLSRFLFRLFATTTKH